MVVSSIHLYDEIALSTDEIHDVSSDRGLALELKTHQPSIAKSRPEESLGVCGLLS